ncbi:xanthine dehydrogenase family protein molybdopterin-binding subunit [Undibacterium sp. CY18W]|uniref:Xanthine dehydrogenase family protein molybdopterin-binding subunit n=1 Tax=Undibacterium hunanense TaxID=2762292 RepID=A0ABR6ZQ20_9BURK|nr:molybdopterin cofactor-binding domain-containing protein [Undibacterium hunanense]MBC3917953.1 xanthine dehydrogenase family protein molybdopterin-binding subunit [Undibacterium hunanense]
MDRRSFLRLSSFSAGAWLLSEALPAALAQTESGSNTGLVAASGAVSGVAFHPSPLIRIAANGQITLFVQKQEMGQGVRTAMPVLLAEELDADFNKITIEALPYDAASAGQYNTWASASVKGGWGSLRKAGAAARAMLASAAASTWNISVERVKTSNSTVINLDTNAVLPYAALIEAASKLPVPANPALKPRSEYKLIGKPVKRYHAEEKGNGQEQFGMDFSLPGMLMATIVRSPTFFGKVRSFDDSAVKALGPGIIAVLEVKQMNGCDNRNGVAIVASNTWLALQGQSLLKVEWDQGPALTNPDSATLSVSMRATIKNDTPALSYDKQGKSKAYIAAPDASFSAEYELPFLNQAPMEVPNCVASYQDGKYDIWGGFQAPGFFASTLAKAFEVDKSAIFAHLLPMGGAFGRKEKVDNAAEAMQLSKALGKPVKLIFSRPDDMRNSFYRPATFHRLSARADKSGIQAWHHQLAVSTFPAKTIASAQHIYGGPSNDLIYPAADYQSGFYPVESPIPVGSWRSISYSQNVFAVESFIDELAVRNKADPLEYRLMLLRQYGNDTVQATHRKRMEAVLLRCADAIGWRKPAARGRYRGIACCVYTHTHAYTAHAFEISVSSKNVVKIHKTVCVTDCGVVVDPSGFRAQIEGSMVWGLSAVMKGEITVKDGAVEQQNFSDYQVLRLNELPPMEIIVIDSEESPAGAGEPAVPSIAPALCNAIAAATKGKRVRALPLSKAGFSFV